VAVKVARVVVAVKAAKVVVVGIARHGPSRGM
jgi:hypothetical protein